MPTITSTFNAFASAARLGSTAGGWSFPANAQTTDDARAVLATTPTTAGYTDWLVATGLASQIPANATITGITVSIERSDPQGTAVDSSVRLVVGGLAAGAERTSSAGWPTVDGVATYGGAADLWGVALTPSQINAGDFGVEVSAKISTGGFDQTPREI